MRRHVLGLAAMFGSIFFVILAAPGLVKADVSGGIAAPTTLVMTLPGTTHSVLPGGWINQLKFDAHFQVQVTGGPLTPQIEIQPVNVPFTGESNFGGAPLTASGTATVAVNNLVNGRTYHWQARVVDLTGIASPWVQSSPGGVANPDLGIDQNPPSRPTMKSSTNPDDKRWYNARLPEVRWQARDSLSGIQGYSFQLLRVPHVIKPGAVTAGTGARFSNLADGVWWVAVRAVDRAGNWSATGTFRFMLDRSSPQVWWLGPKRLHFNPLRGPARLQFKVSKDATIHLHLWRVGDRAPTASYSFPSLHGGQVITIVWNGKNARGKAVPKGFYYFAADATDRASNVLHTNLGGIAVAPELAMRSPSGQLLYPDGGKRIIVSLSQETLYAYDGTKLQLRTVVTTGNPVLPTPPGTYVVMARYHPFQFVSPWPEGSPYYYPPSWSQYALLFRDGGYFLHDAPWRSAFGPGTNGPGQPGSNYGGTHGCVNIPPSAMGFLWNWTPIGTTVLVVP